MISLQQGRCVIDLAKREIRVDGELRSLEPRPFEVLAYLIDQQDCVVSKWELLHAVWAGEDVTPAALTRAVMKLRQALGDDEAQSLIRTIPRVGYRLVVDAQDAGASPDRPPEAAPADGSEALRVAFLPVQNATGDPALEWAELGLMSLMSNQASHQGWVLPVMPASVLAAQQGVAGASMAEMEDMVRRATGAQVLVRGRLSRAGRMFQLDFDCVGTSWIRSGRVTGPQASELGLRMMKPMVELLLPGVVLPETCGDVDPLALAAFARALQAAALQRSKPALHLLKMALDLMPDCVAVQLELLNVTCTLGDTEQAQPLMDGLVAHAEAHADLRLAARVHLAMGRMHLQHQSLRPAAFQLEKALRLMDERTMPDEVCLALMLRAH
ncbi:MAG TPA: winged helix-turn-helix domain-containing protein, partial [Burkholderiaceae bacterium]|nr:winged helix-turn-helix domain-containing protein [Burkholderiaceae bacterium]